MESVPQILVVDDDRDIRDLISRFLKKNGLRVQLAANGRDMWQILETAAIDLVVLDRVMPGEDGIWLCGEIRKSSRVPVIMLTLLGSDKDRIVGFEMGADDYVVKPFNPHELLARIRAVLRRVTELPTLSPLQRAKRLKFSGWSIDRITREVTNPDGVLVMLTDGEFDLLLCFAERSQLVLTREQLLDLTRGRDAVAFDRSIDMQLARLRKKVERDPDNPVLIKTIRNKGYIFTPEVTGEAV